MAAKKQSSAQGKEDARDVLSSFRAAIEAYGQALAEASASAEKGVRDAYLEYAGSVSKLQQRGQEVQLESTRELVETVGGAGREVAPEQLAGAQRKYQETLQGAGQTLQQDAGEIQRRWVEAQQQAQSHCQKLAHDAGRQYLKALKEAWGSVDVDAIDGAVLAAIGQSMLAAAAQLAAAQRPEGA